MALAPHLREFENLTAWLDAACAPHDPDPETQRVHDQLGYKSHVAGVDITDTYTWNEALDLARNGWEDGRRMMESWIARLDERLESQMPTPEIRYDVTGDVLDIGRYVNGEPEDFMYMADSEDWSQAPQPRFVRIVYNMGMLGHVNRISPFIRGAAMLAVVTMLERRNVRCAIDLVAIDSQNSEIRIHAKEFNEPLQLDKFAFLMAHRSAHRRFNFAIREHFPVHLRRQFDYVNGGGMGSTSDYTDDKGDVYMPGLTEDWSERRAINWAIDCLTKFGFNLKEGN